jgi:hypothetical protein
MHTAAADKALEERPPVIEWRLNAHGIWVHTYIFDPHVDAADRSVCRRGHAFDEENTVNRAEGSRPCKKCKKIHRHVTNTAREL